MAFSDLINKAKAATDSMKSSVDRYKNKSFMEAFAACCAYVSFADGSVDDSEKKKMKTLFDHNELLQSFDKLELIEQFNKYIKYFEMDLDVGEEKAMSAIQKLSGKDDAARTLVRLCVSIANSDGEFDDAEKKVVKKVCDELSINFDFD